MGLVRVLVMTLGYNIVVSTVGDFVGMDKNSQTWIVVGLLMVHIAHQATMILETKRDDE